MSILPLYGNPPKREIIQMAREECATAGYEFEETPEEEASALRRLQAMMAEWLENEGIDLGFYFSPNGYGSGTEGSGIPAGAVNTVATFLAFRLAPNMGKSLSPETKASLNRSMNTLMAKYKAIPQMEMGRNTIRGAGNRRYVNLGTPFFAVDVSDDEIVQ